MEATAEQQNNKRIAKNTVFLYFRMFFTMVISLYTSRVVLQKLGVEDFGIYQTVGGVVALLSYANNALGVGTSRFLTFELGKKDGQLKNTFATVLNAHIILAAIILILACTIGFWFVCNKLVIPPNRMGAAIFAYFVSVLTCMVTITQVPYTGSIISHEKMSVYAYLSIIETSLKLGIVLLLVYSPIDKLKFYAALLCFVHVAVALYYRFYCVRHFRETKFKFFIDFKILKSVLAFSGWNLFSSTSVALANQGVSVLLNVFFNPSVVAARAIANQVNMAANQFVGSFRTAVNPQVIKKFAAGDRSGSEKLLLTSAKYSFYMMLALCVPICITSDELLRIWLTVVPEYASVFLRFAIVSSLFAVFDLSFYTALNAKGNIKLNAIFSSFSFFLGFVAIYVAFKLGASPVISAIILLISQMVIAMIIKPILLVKIVQYDAKSILNVFGDCLKITCLSLPLPLCCFLCGTFNSLNDLLKMLAYIAVSEISIIACVWLWGVPEEHKKILLVGIKKKNR